MNELPKVFVRYERDAITKRMVRASTESNLPPLDKVSELKTRIKELEVELEKTRTQSQCELYDELYKAALGLSHGVDWNNGTQAITHGYRDRLINAVNKIKAGE